MDQASKSRGVSSLTGCYAFQGRHKVRPDVLDGTIKINLCPVAAVVNFAWVAMLTGRAIVHLRSLQVTHTMGRIVARVLPLCVLVSNRDILHPLALFVIPRSHRVPLLPLSIIVGPIRKEFFYSFNGLFLAQKWQPFPVAVIVLNIVQADNTKRYVVSRVDSLRIAEEDNVVLALYHAHVGGHLKKGTREELRPQ